MNICEFLTLGSLEKVGSSVRPQLTETEGVMLKNEVYSFQIAMAVTQGEDILFSHVRMESDIAKYTEVRRAELVPVQTAAKGNYDDYYLTKDPAMIPDVLLPLTEDGFHIFLHQWRTLWITVRGKGNIPTGTHVLKFFFISENGEFLGEASYTLKILDALLPKQKLLYTNWVHYDSICHYYNTEPFSNRFYELTKSFLKTAAEHGMNVLYVPLFTPPLDTAIGGERKTIQLIGVRKEKTGYVFNFSEFEKFIGMAREIGYTYFEMSHLFTQWGAKAAPKIIADVDGEKKRIFGWDTPSDGKEYIDFLTAFLPRLVEELRILGIDGHTFFHVSDEPNAEDFGHYEKASALVRSLIGDIPFIDANSNLNAYLDGTSPHPIPATSEAEAFLPYHIPDLWVYFCSAQHSGYLSNRFIAMPSQRTRVLGVQLYMNDIVGLLHWGYNFYESFLSKHSLNPYICSDAGGAWQSGDTFIVYPGENGALDSIRHELTFDAFQDIAALELLENKIGREKVKAFLRKEGVKEGFREYPRDARWHLKLRRKIYEKYFGKNLGND